MTGKLEVLIISSRFFKGSESKSHLTIMAIFRWLKVIYVVFFKFNFRIYLTVKLHTGCVSSGIDQREQPSHSAFLSDPPTVKAQFTQVSCCYDRPAALNVFHNLSVCVCGVLPRISPGDNAAWHHMTIERWSGSFDGSCFIHSLLAGLELEICC